MKGDNLLKGELVELIPAHPTGDNKGLARGVAPLQGTVDSVEDPLFRIRVKKPTLTRGDAVRAQRRVVEDARYTLNGLVEIGGAPIVVIRALGPWMRVQQREFVRFRLQARILAHVQPDTSRGGLLGAGGRSREMDARIIDISAGGAHLEPSAAVQLGDRMELRFTLPSAGEIKVAATVVRSSPAVRNCKARAGVRFLNLPSAHETLILRWIYDQQIRKRRHTMV